MTTIHGMSVKHNANMSTMSPKPKNYDDAVTFDGGVNSKMTLIGMNQESIKPTNKNDYEDLLNDIEKDFAVIGFDSETNSKFTSSKKESSLAPNFKLRDFDEETLDPQSRGINIKEKIVINQHSSNQTKQFDDQTIETAKLKPGNLNESSDLDLENF